MKLFIALAFLAVASALPQPPKPIELPPPSLPFEKLEEAPSDIPSEFVVDPVRIVDAPVESSDAVEAQHEPSDLVDPVQEEVLVEPVQIVDVPEQPEQTVENNAPEFFVEPVKVVDAPLESAPETYDAHIEAEVAADPVQIVDSPLEITEEVQSNDAPAEFVVDPVKIVDAPLEAAEETQANDVPADFAVDPVQFVDAPLKADEAFQTYNAPIDNEVAVDPVQIVDGPVDAEAGVDAVHVVDLPVAESDDIRFPIPSIKLFDIQPLFISADVLRQFQAAQEVEQPNPFEYNVMAAEPIVVDQQPIINPIPMEYWR